LKVTTPLLGWPGGPGNLPLDTGLLDLGPVSPGKHLLSIEAEGQAGGCNVGKLVRWGGKLVVVTDDATAGADLRIAKNGPATVFAGTNVNSTVTVTNNGPSAAQSVAFSDPLPANTTFVSVAQNSGPAFNCISAGGAVKCTTATLASGAAATFTLVHNVPAATPGGSKITNTVSVSSTTSDPTPGNNSVSASTTVIGKLEWKPIPQNQSGPLFPAHFGATVPGGALILSVLNRADGDGVALSFVPQPVNRLDWRQLPQNQSGPAFPTHFQATVPGGALMVSVLTRTQGNGVGISFLPRPVIRLDWQQIPQNQSGPLFPSSFGATVPGGGALIVSVLNRTRGTGVGLGFVPQPVSRFDWQQIPQNQSGTLFPTHFAAPAAGGALVISVLNRAEGDGVALDFVPQPVNRIDWQQIQQNQSGPLFPTPFAAAVPRGALIVSVLNRARGTGTGLAFFPR